MNLTGRALPKGEWPAALTKTATRAAADLDHLAVSFTRKTAARMNLMSANLWRHRGQALCT